MPAAAISVHPADAVDCELFNLDFLKDAGLFTACFGYDLLCFHDSSPFLCSFSASFVDAFCFVYIYATLMPKNKTTIYAIVAVRKQVYGPPGSGLCVEKMDIALEGDKYAHSL